MQSNNSGRKMLKISSILLIIGGVISIVLGIIALIGVGALHALTEDGSSLGVFYAVGGLVLASGVLSLIAGIIGLGACNNPEKAGKCVIYGIIIVVMTIIGQILSLMAGNKFNPFSIVIGLLLPVVYILGANKIKNSVNPQ